MKRELTHVVALIDTTISPLTAGHMIQARAVEALEYAQNLARAWRTECKNTDHIVVIAAVRQIQRLEPTVTFTNIIGE
jgi:hypothetical protein